MILSRSAWRIVACSIAAGFFLLALRFDVYNATSPPGLSRLVFGHNTPALDHPWWLALHIWVRKFYSVVAFGLVGFSIHRSLAPTRLAALRTAAIVAAYSLGIEIAQYAIVPAEPLAERILDIGCGAFGGWIAVVLDARANAALQARRA